MQISHRPLLLMEIPAPATSPRFPMTKPRTSGLFDHALARGWKGGSVRKLSLWKMVGIVFVFCAVTAVTSPAQFLTTLVNFSGLDGSAPYATLVRGTDGNFYGTTFSGGADGAGTVFKMTAGGTLTTLHSFDGADGYFPYAGLVQATDGNFYGTTTEGGAYRNCGGGAGCGTVFKMTPEGTLTTLHSFDGTDGGEGEFPSAGLVQATDGNFYGTTQGGGSGICSNGCGTVFKITPSGTLTTLHSFNSADGEYPYAGLVQATDGNFYGTTTGGGAQYFGTVFKITPEGTLTTLYSFGNGLDGGAPIAGLVQATNGNFYGTTVRGGNYCGYGTSCGTVFKITPGGTLTTLYSFCAQSGCADGEYPYAGLVQATDGHAREG